MEILQSSFLLNFPELPAPRGGHGWFSLGTQCGAEDCGKIGLWPLESNGGDTFNQNLGSFFALNITIQGHTWPQQRFFKAVICVFGWGCWMCVWFSYFVDFPGLFRWVVFEGVLDSAVPTTLTGCLSMTQPFTFGTNIWKIPKWQKMFNGFLFFPLEERIPSVVANFPPKGLVPTEVGDKGPGLAAQVMRPQAGVQTDGCFINPWSLV